MKEEIKYLEKIERYVNDQLTEAEKEDFEKKLAADKKLADEVEWYKAAKNLVIHAGRNELKNKFAAFEKELSPSTGRIMGLSAYRLLSIAAAVLMLLAAGIWYLKKQPATGGPEQVFIAHFEPYRNPVWVRSNASPAPADRWPAAVEAYTNGRYDEAARLFEAALSDSLTPDYLARFYRGVSLLARPHPDARAAIAQLDRVLATDNDYHQQARWYKALALLLLEEKKAAKKILFELQKEGGFKEKELAGLLREL